MYVLKHVQPMEYPNLIKKYGDICNQLTQKSVVTSDSVFQSLGFGGSKVMCRHFKEFIKEEHDINTIKKSSTLHVK